jgi:hypothetical protein
MKSTTKPKAKRVLKTKEVTKTTKTSRGRPPRSTASTTKVNKEKKTTSLPFKGVEKVALDILLGMSQEQKKDLRALKEKSLIGLHHGWGTSIRNKYLHGKKGVDPHMADSVSQQIIKRVWELCQLKKSPKVFKDRPAGLPFTSSQLVFLDMILGNIGANKPLKLSSTQRQTVAAMGLALESMIEHLQPKAAAVKLKTKARIKTKAKA